MHNIDIFYAENSESVEVSHGTPHDATDYERTLSAMTPAPEPSVELHRWEDDGGPCA